MKATSVFLSARCRIIVIFFAFVCSGLRQCAIYDRDRREMGSYEAFVCIDRLDAIGIYDEVKKYTHYLQVICRIEK